MRLLPIVLLVAILGVGPAGAAYKPVRQTNDVSTIIDASRSVITLSQGDSLDYWVWAYDGRTPLRLTGETWVVLAVASWTNADQAWIVSTGSVVVATSGAVRVFVDADDTWIPASNYLAEVRAYSLYGTSTQALTIARSVVTVLPSLQAGHMRTSPLSPPWQFTLDYHYYASGGNYGVDATNGYRGDWGDVVSNRLVEVEQLAQLALATGQQANVRADGARVVATGAWDLAVAAGNYSATAGNASALKGNTNTPLYSYAESDPVWLAQKSGYATGAPVYAESDPMWAAEKSGYATGTPVYVETDPVWLAALEAGLPGATNVVAGSEDSYDSVTKTLTWNTNKAAAGSGGADPTSYVARVGSRITGSLMVTPDQWIAQSLDVAPPSTLSLGTGASWTSTGGVMFTAFGVGCTVSNPLVLGAGRLYVSGEVWRITSGSGGGFEFKFRPRVDGEALFVDSAYSPAVGSSTNFEATFDSTGRCNVVAFSGTGSGPTPAIWAISNLTIRYTPDVAVASDGSSLVRPTWQSVVNHGNSITSPVVINVSTQNTFGGPAAIIIDNGNLGVLIGNQANIESPNQAGAFGRWWYDPIAIGHWAQAHGGGGVAVGGGAWAGFISVALGPLAYADQFGGQDGGIAIGNEANARQASIAIGEQSVGYWYSTVVGGEARGEYSESLGYRATSSNYSLALGGNSKAESGPPYENYGAAVGTFSYATKASAAIGGAAGAYSKAFTNNTLVGFFAQAGADNNAVIGSRISNAVERSTRVLGDLYLDGTYGTGNKIVFSNGTSKLVCAAETNLYWCTIGYTGLLNMTAADLPE